MKKLVSMILMGCLLFGAVGLAQENKTETLVGEVVEVLENGFLFQNDQWGEVQVNTDEKTIIEGQQTLLPGDYVTVFFSGAMTASLPPQIYGTKVVCIKIEGEVTGITEDGKSIVVEALEKGQVVVHLPQEAISIPAVGSYVILYYNGIETMSLPPQLNPQKMTAYGLLTGEVTQMEEDFLMLGEGDDAVRVNISKEETIMADDIKIGDTVQVLHNGRMTRSLPPQVFANRITIVQNQEEPAK